MDLVLLGSQGLDEVDGRGELEQFLIESAADAAASAWVVIHRLVEETEEVEVAVLDEGDASLHDLEERARGAPCRHHHELHDLEEAERKRSVTVRSSGGLN